MVSIRPARQTDVSDVQTLLIELGYNVSPEDVHRRLTYFLERPTDPILLAVEADIVLGMIALHCAAMLQHRRPVARITVLVVRPDMRGKGVGRLLVEAGADLAKQAGCGLVELTTALHRTDAQAFYQSIGFLPSSLRLHRLVD